MDRSGETRQMPRNLKNEDVYTKRRRIAWLAGSSPELGFTSLNHLIDTDWLKEAFRLTRKSGAPGVDGQRAQEYEENLEENLQNLLDRAKSGRYRAPPVWRKHIPKGTGSETRPIGIPTFEDKVLQRAIVMLLEPIYSALPTTGVSRARGTGRLPKRPCQNG